MKAWHRPLVALGLLAPACAPGHPQPAHKARPGPVAPLHPLTGSDEATTTTVTTTTTYVLPEAETEESDEQWWQSQPGYVSGACGGSLPPCYVMRRESGGNPSAVNATGCGGRGCYGKWQFDPRTSRGLGYPLPMNQYPESVQDEAARALWAGGQGCSHWAAC